MFNNNLENTQTVGHHWKSFIKNCLLYTQVTFQEQENVGSTIKSGVRMFFRSLQVTYKSCSKSHPT